jgi:large subunit ribosomal protein L17
MRHKVKKTAKLGRKHDHRDLLLRNLATSLVEKGKIQTTAAKARAVQPFIERLLANTKRKVEPRIAIRYLQTNLLTERAQKKVFQELTKKYADRASGFTRVTPLGFRTGDNAPKVQIEFI